MKTMREIAIEVAAKHRMTVDQMRVQCRRRRFVRARQEAMWVMHQERRWSLMQIAGAVGVNHHTTVLQGVAAYEARLTGAPNPWIAKRERRTAADLEAWRNLGKPTGEKITVDSRDCRSPASRQTVGL